MCSSDLEEEEMQAPPEMADELVEMLEQEDINEHRVVEEPIESARREEELVHRVVEDSFGTLHKDQVHAWLGVRKNGKQARPAVCCPLFPASRFDEVKAIWMAAAARRLWTGCRRRRHPGVTHRREHHRHLRRRGRCLVRTSS